MIATKLVQLVAASSVAILLSLNGAAPANALSVDNHAALAARHAHISSNLTVKKKRGTSRRCKNRPAAFTQSKKPASSTTKSAPTKAASNNGKNNNDDDNEGKGNSGGGSGSNSGAGTGPKNYNGSKVGVAFTGDESILGKIKTGKVGP